MSQLRLVDDGILWINSDPAHKHVSVFFPSVVQWSEKEFICLYQRGDGLYAVNNHIAVLRSRDGGVTWNEEGAVHDPSLDDRRYSYHATFTSRLRDGTLVLCPFRADRSDPQQPFFTDTGGLIANEPVLFTSRDKGQSWSGPTVMSLPKGLNATQAHSIIELDRNRWFAAFDQWPAYDDPGPYRPVMLGFYSNDRGQTWQDPVVMADGSADGKGFWHGRPLRLHDGRFFSLFWSADMTDPERGPVNLPIHYAHADPTGRHWERPAPTSIPGQTNCTTQLPDGRLAAIYTGRECDQPGFMVVLAEDDGRNWDLKNQVRVWDASGWATIGLNSPDRYPRSHDTIAFGAPALITTLNGELFASWWCTYASLTHIRWARIAVE